MERLKEGFPDMEGDGNIATYIGSGDLVVNGGRVSCGFRADQESNGRIQILFNRINANDFLNTVLANELLDSGINVSFRR
jgi:hypothetical protein